MLQVGHVHIPNASPSWKLIMQSGVRLSVTVGLPLSTFLTSELKLTEQDQNLIEALVLDGMPVDDPSTAIIEDGSRLAMAAGLPGIVGLAMKKNSAVRALRASITHRNHENAPPGSGRIILSLYSLVLPALGGHFLNKGLFITPAQFKRYAAFAPDNVCEFSGRNMTAHDFAQELSLGEPEEIFMTATVSED